VGQLAVPASGNVYVDTSCLIYTVERHPDFYPILSPLWNAAQAGKVTVVSSEIAILECLVGPLKTGDAAVLADYEAALNARDLRLIAIDNTILKSAARLRALFNLRTPDAIHAATALSVGAAIMATNDPHFDRLPGLQVQVLSRL
jgi:predicted nucleic acid-binding protein